MEALQNNTKPSRLLWLDMANVLAMVGVVLFHIPSGLEMPVRDDEFVAVNECFFLMSGVSLGLILRNVDTTVGLLEFLKKRILRLVVPTLMFFVLFYVLWLVMGRKLAGDAEQWYVPLSELATGKLHTVVAPYWFVICLLTMNIIFSVAHGLLPDKRVMFLVLGCVPALNLLPLPDVFELHYALKFFPYMVLGSLFFISEKGRANLCLSFVAGCACCYILYKVVNADEELFGWSNAYGLVYTLVILVLSKILEKLTYSRILSLLRSGALVLLATQNYIIGFARIVLDRLTHQDDFLVNHIVFKPLVLLAVYAITLPLIWLIVNYAPFVLGKKKIATK